MVVEVVSASGEVNGKVPWFAEDEGLGAEAMTVVSVLGAQGSGKSTLLNALLGTGFSVAKKGSLLGAATTRGVVADKAAESQLLMAFDVEGADGRERAGREGKKFAAILAGFAGALSDVVLLNLFANEVGNVNSTVMQLLEAVFAQMAKGADGAARGRGFGARRTLEYDEDEVGILLATASGRTLHVQVNAATWDDTPMGLGE